MKIKHVFVCFSNAHSFWGFVRSYLNLMKLACQTLLSSNLTTPTLKTIEHLKKRTNTCFIFILLKVTFSHFFHDIKKKLFHILNLHKIYVFNNIFKWSWLSKKWPKSDFSKLFAFLWTQLDSIVFLVFHPHDPKPKRIHQMASNSAKTWSTRSQTCVKYKGIITFI